MTERYDWQFWVVCIFGMISMGWTLRKLGLWRQLGIIGLMLTIPSLTNAQLAIGTAVFHPRWQVRTGNGSAVRLTADLCDPQGEIYNPATAKWSLDAWDFRSSTTLALYDQGGWCWGTTRVGRMFCDNTNGYQSLTADTWGLFDVYWIYGDDIVTIVDPDDNEYNIPLISMQGQNILYFAAPGTDLLEVGQTLPTSGAPAYYIQISVTGEIGNVGNDHTPPNDETHPAPTTQTMPAWLERQFNHASTQPVERPHSSMNFFEELTGTTIPDANSIVAPTPAEAAAAATDLLYELGIGYEGETTTPIGAFVASAWGYDPDKNVLSIGVKKAVTFANTYLSWLPPILAFIIIWDTVICCLCLIMWGLAADNAGVRRLAIWA